MSQTGTADFDQVLFSQKSGAILIAPCCYDLPMVKVHSIQFAMPFLKVKL
jgi:hypothetical protein